MKKSIILAILLIPTICSAQGMKKNRPNVVSSTDRAEQISLRFEEIGSMNDGKIHELSEYITSTGESYKVGDTVVLGRASNVHNEYDYVIQTMTAVLATNNHLGSVFDGQKAIIKRMALGSTGYVVFNTKITAWPGTFNIRIEEAIRSGEVKSDYADEKEALEKIKKAKDMLELDLITKEQYDSIKAVYGKYIRL